MSAAAQSGADTVFRLIYRSHSLIDDGDRSAQLAAIFTTARQNNRSHDITGALLVTDSVFVQALEGEESEVRGLFDTICGDGRHEDVTLIEQELADRTFGRWAMAEVSTDDHPDRRLVSRPGSDEIVTMGKDPSITPAQEQVLAFMRDAAVQSA